MHVFIAVIDDLYSFALGVLLAPVRALSREYQRTLEDVPIVESSNIETDIGAEFEEKEIEDDTEPPSFRKVEEVIIHGDAERVIGGEKNTVMYSGGPDTPVYKNPTQEFDSMVGVLGYGDMVMVLEQKGRWAHVIHGEESGWTLRDGLVDRAVHVYPKFIIGEVNDHDDPNTIRVRAIIGDMFGGARGEMPLQAGEYVTYRLHRKGLDISWPAIRPRVPGLWHSLLKGVTGIHIGITPKTGAIMEYMLTDDIGHLAYVEAVFPDETINISEANFPDSGIYNERVLTRDEWRELKPVFIQVV